MLQLKGRVAIVTGSARGIGEAIARRFAAAGCAVIVNARSVDGPGPAVADSLPEARFVAADVTARKGAERIVDAAVDAWGRVDYLVNSAGVTRVVPFDDLGAVTEEDWLSCLGVNALGIWHTTCAALPELRASEGAVVNITSASGVLTTGSSIPYSVSKAAANHLTKLLAKTLAPEVRVNAVAPGFVETPLTASMGPTFREGFEKKSPLGRAGSPEEIGDAVFALATNDFVTGSILLADGGLAVG